MNPKRLNLNLAFSLDGIPIQAINMTYERFLRTIPTHSHGSGSYEIHYIPFGYGKLTVEGKSMDIVPNTLFVTGPHVEHAQAPVPEEPMQEYCIYLKIRDTARSKAGSPLMEGFLSTPFWFGADSQGIHGLMLQLFDELERRPIGYLDQARLLLSQLLIHIVRNYKSAQPGHPSPAPGSIANLSSVIIEEYFLYEYRSLSLEELACRLSPSPRQTQGLLLSYYGKSFQQKRRRPKCQPPPSFSPINPKALLPSRKNRATPPRNISPPLFHSHLLAGYSAFLSISTHCDYTWQVTIFQSLCNTTHLLFK